MIHRTIAFVLVVVVFAPGVSARQLHVPDRFLTIEDAIDASVDALDAKADALDAKTMARDAIQRSAAAEAKATRCMERLDVCDETRGYWTPTGSPSDKN